MIGATRSPSERSRAELLAVLLAAAGFVLLGELAGVASAAAVGLVWLVLPVVYAVAFGHVLVAALTIDGVGIPGIVAVLLVELGLLAMVLIPAATLYGRDTTVSVAVFALGVFVFAFGIAVLSGGALWIGALALVSTGALASYGMHRYELVSLGLVEGST